MKRNLISFATLLCVLTSARAQDIDILSPGGLGGSAGPRKSSPADVGQGLLPTPSPVGNDALEKLLSLCRKNGAVEVKDAESDNPEYTLADEEKVKAVADAHPELLTSDLRDAIVARWNTAYQIPPRPERPSGYEGFGKGLDSIIHSKDPAIHPTDEGGQRLAIVLLRAVNAKARDDKSLAFAAFLEGQAQERKGDYEAARPLYERGRELFAAAGDATWKAVCLNNLGLISAREGEYAQALKQIQGALEIAKDRGRDDPLVAACQENLGEIDVRLGDYRGAAKCLEKARDVWSKAPGENRFREAVVRVSLGDVYDWLDRYGGEDKQDAALEQFEKALALWRTILNESRLGASTLLEQVNSDTSYDMAKAANAFQALSALHKVYGNGASMEAATLDKIGDIYAGPKRKEYDKARDEYLLALGIRRKAFGESHPEVALSHYKIGAICAGQGKYAEAEKELSDAVLALRQAPAKASADVDQLTPDDLCPLPLTAAALHEYGKALEQTLGKSPTALQLRSCAHVYSLAAGALERMRRQVLQTESSKAVLGAESFDLFARHVGVCKRLHDREGKAEDLETAFTVAEQGTARVFLEQMAQSHAESIGQVSDAFRKQETDLVEHLRDLDARIDREQNKPGKPQNDALAELFEERRQAEDKRRELVARMEREYPSYAALKYPRPCSLAAARACLNPNEVALLYVLGTEASYVVLLEKEVAEGDKSNGLAVYALPAGDIAALVAELTKPAALAQSETANSQRAKGYDLLLSPLAERIKGKDLLIVPNGVLYRLPFELLTEKGEDPDRHYLIENHRIRYAPSLTILSLVRQWDKTRTAPDHLLWAVGDAVYETSDDRAAGAKELDSISLKALKEYQGRRPDADDRRFERLAYSGEELQTIGRILGASPGDILTGLKASEAAVKEASEKGVLERARYVHFATHGVLGSDAGRQPSLVLSLIGNDGREEGGGVNDGFLQMDEVTHLRLNADLVVLSACRSGQGRLRNGEGEDSLSRAFLCAGSRAVLCSLWPVADRETAGLMAEVYRNLKADRPPADAVREAQLAMIKASKAPCYWAPFIVIGE